MTTTRRLDRIASAGLRAVSGEARAEVRGRRLEVAEKPILVVVPYLALGDRGGSGPDQTVQQRRGLMDGLALRVRHSDPVLHQQLSPRPILERIVFDIAEQFRCEALADPALPGVKANTAAAFERWSDSARAAKVAETGVGLLVFTITHMLRSRLLRVPSSEAVDDLIEVTRGNLAKLVGHALKALPSVVDDQAEFAVPAAEIARLVAEMVDDASASADDVPESVIDNALLIPIDWDLLEELTTDDGAEGFGSEKVDDYHVFTAAYDTEVVAAGLYRAAAVRELRTELDGHVAAQAVSVARLAQRLQRLFPVRLPDGWSGGEEDGLLDPSRLAQLVADPTNRLVHRRERFRPTSDATVSFLIDTSGSMKAQRYESVAVLVDTLVRALEMAGAGSEVLGFTTGAWGGGRAMADWRSQGSPPDPGRLNEVQYIVYKHAEQPWRQARLAMATMLRTDHYREGVDGEAIEWAYRRLLHRPERRRALVVISDGAPMDAATANANQDGFLADHLRSVAHRIEHAGLIELGAVGIDLQLDEFISNSISLDLTGTLTVGTYDVLHRLFG
ncbi:MAG: cobaltochelatase CobT-related protein [Acidimicrobiales bacterium]